MAQGEVLIFFDVPKTFAKTPNGIDLHKGNKGLRVDFGDTSFDADALSGRAQQPQLISGLSGEAAFYFVDGKASSNIVHNEIHQFICLLGDDFHLDDFGLKSVQDKINGFGQDYLGYQCIKRNVDAEEKCRGDDNNRVNGH